MLCFFPYMGDLKVNGLCSQLQYLKIGYFPLGQLIHSLHFFNELLLDMNLLKLPEDIVCELLSLWVGTKDCVHFDSAYCNFFKLFKGSLVLQTSPPNKYAKDYLRWLFLRGICTSEIMISGCSGNSLGGNDYPEYASMCSKYLVQRGSTIKMLTINWTLSSAINLAASHCINLMNLSLVDCDVTKSLWILISNSARLTELRMNTCTFTRSKYLPPCDLRKLCIENTNGGINDDELISLVELCPNLKALYIWSAASTAETFQSIAKLCTHIKSVSLHGCRHEHSPIPLIAILDFVHAGLVALDIHSIPLTEEIVEAIITKHAATLRHLKADFMTDKELYLRLLCACTELHTLDMTYCNEEEVSSVIGNVKLPKLQTLMCGAYAYDHDLMESIINFTKYSPELTTLCLYDSLSPCMEKYIATLGATRPALHTIFLHDYSTNVRFVRNGKKEFRKEDWNEEPPQFDVLSFPVL